MKKNKENTKEQKAFKDHCMRMNAVVLLRNTTLSHLTDDQYNGVVSRESERSYKLMDEATE